jgi:hypothetical protein
MLTFRAYPMFFMLWNRVCLEIDLSNCPIKPILYNSE